MVAAVGQVIPYDYMVTNSGNTTITAAISVADDKVASVSCPPLPGGGLLPGNSIQCTGNYTVLQTDVDAGSIINTASATDGTITSPQDSLTINYVALDGSIKLERTANIQSFFLPDTPIIYTYTITNIGASNLSDVVLTDSKLGQISCPQNALNAGQVMICTAQYLTTLDDLRNGGVANVAEVRSLTVSQLVVSATTSLTIGFDPTIIRKRTLTAIHTFLNARAQLIVSSQPDRQRILNRLSERPRQCSGRPDGSMLPDLNSVNINSSMSTSEMCMATSNFDFWSEVYGSYYKQKEEAIVNQGAFNMSYFGVDYAINHKVVTGVLIAGDYINSGTDTN